MSMHHEEASAARNVTNSDPEEGIQRLELLGWRFSSAEIDNLSRLQRHYRERPEAIDLPLEECRWWFARWLVEHGKIGEGDGVEFSARPPGNESNLPPPLELETAAQLDDAQSPEYVSHEAWHRRLLGRIARAWRSILGPGSEAGRHRRAIRENAQWYPSPRDSYSRPYSLTMAQMMWLGFPPYY